MMRTTQLGTLLSLALLSAACGDSALSTPDLAGVDLAGSVDQAAAGWKVGGTATGVSGTGLVLALNGAVDLAVPASGAFSFPTALFNGQAYVVTVKTQPTAPVQSCVVASGAGTIAGADVSSVKVTCTTPSWKVGGTVIGYQGHGLILRDNGGDDLAVAANGSFQFATPVASGDMYTVTVAAQPLAPVQTCQVAGGTGKVGGADVASVVINCAANTFTVAGSVTGLVGSVELSLNGQYAVTVSAADSTFAFAIGLADLSPYNVTVKTAPGPSPAQTCSIEKGQGQIAGANVANVKVVCVNKSFPVRVTVLGLGDGVSVTLQNHGGDNLVASSNDTFSFAAQQASGTAIAVTVSQQPGPVPTQTCSFTGGNVGATVQDRAIDLELTCVSKPFHVVGTVTGLPLGQSITLHNGSTDLVRNADGLYDLGVVLSGNTYDVTVSAQPTAPTYCSVHHGKGRVGASDATVNVSCAVPKDCAELFSLNPTLPSGAYGIDPDGAAGAPFFQVYCDMVTAGGGWTVVYAASGANDEQPLTSDVAQNGNPLVGQHHNLTRAQKMALAALSTESLFSRTNDESWLRASKPMFDQNLATPNSVSAVAVKLVSSDGVTADAFMGYATSGITGGGDFGIAMNPDGFTCGGIPTVNGFDQHNTTAYRHLNCGCERMYLYSYSAADLDGDAGYDINTGLGGWYGSDGCNFQEGGNLAFLAAMRRNISPASCAAVLMADPAASDGVYALSSLATGTYPAYCDMSGGGWTLLLAALGNSSFWGNASDNWRRTELRNAPPTAMGSLADDHRSGAYGGLPTNAIRLCYGDTAHCYTFTHGLNLALAQFFIQGVSYTKYAFDALFAMNTGSDTDRTSFISQLGFGMGTINCYVLAINYPNMGGGLGLLGDGNAGCASMGPQGGNFWMDDYALGLGLNSCADGSCAPDNLTQAGASEGVFQNTFGLWYVFGK